MERILEPEVMDSLEEAIAYDAMDFTEVNLAFVQKAIALAPSNAVVLDAGTGTARIPILLCQRFSNWRIIGIDLAANMLKIGAQHVENAGLQAQIRLECIDVKQLPYPDGHFDLVLSNSLVHHLPAPLPFLKEIKRVLKPNGGILLRDLFRPVDEISMNRLVESIGEDYDAHQKQL